MDASCNAFRIRTTVLKKSMLKIVVSNMNLNCSSTNLNDLLAVKTRTSEIVVKFSSSHFVEVK